MAEKHMQALWHYFVSECTPKDIIFFFSGGLVYCYTSYAHCTFHIVLSTWSKFRVESNWLLFRTAIVAKVYAAIKTNYIQSWHHVDLFLPSLCLYHKASKHSEAHLWFYFHQIFWKGIHPSTDLATHGYSILRILQQILKVSRFKLLIRPCIWICPLSHSSYNKISKLC